jgi:hypothetical protein
MTTTARETQVVKDAVVRLVMRERHGIDFANYVQDPVAFVTDVLDEHLWSKQIEIMESVRDNRHTAVHSCHGSGKSWVAARIVAWWMACHEPGEAFAITTAPTFAQVRAILWREIRRAHRKNLPGKVNQTEWWINDEIVAFGRKPGDYDTDAFQGIHARAVLVILDEASGIPPALWEAVETVVTNDECRVLAIGNPDDPHGEFARKCQPDSGWNAIHVNGLESPNFTDEPIPDHLRGLLISPTWVDERKAEWGDQSPLFVSKVLGQFPEDSDDGVVLTSDIRACQYLDEDERPALPTHIERDRMSGTTEIVADYDVCLGVDVGAGGDETVIRERLGIRAGRTWSARTPESTQAVELVMRAVRECMPDRINVDVIGVGWGIVGRLKELVREAGPGDPLYRVRIDGVNVGASPRDKARFAKLRDELWWVVGRELIQSGAMDLTDLDETTIGQLISPRYSIDAGGRVKIEAKADTRKRIGRSPDDADALLLAYYQGAPAWTID